MVECDDIDKKKNKKCESPAKWIVRINNEIDYIHPRCGRHSRNMDKRLIENTNEIIKEKKKRGRKPKITKNDEKYDNENNELKINSEKDKKEESDIQEISYPKNNNNKDEKIKILFTKIDELCDLLNKKI